MIVTEIDWPARPSVIETEVHKYGLEAEMTVRWQSEKPVIDDDAYVNVITLPIKVFGTNI
jgi:hypothetical protein